MRVEASWLAVAAGLLLAGCRTERGASEDRGDRYSARGQFADAAVEYEIALEAAGEKAPSELRLKAAELALRSKDFNGAERMFDALIERDPDYADRVRALYYLHASRWSSQGDTFAMLRAIDGIRERDSTASLGSLYYQVPGWPLGFGDDDKARQMLQKGLQVNPAGIDANYFYGDFLRDQKDWKGAEAALAKAVAAPPRAGRELADQGRRKEAQAMLSQVRSELAGH